MQIARNSSALNWPAGSQSATGRSEDTDRAVFSHRGLKLAEEKQNEPAFAGEELDIDEQREVERLQRLDQEVRQHEQAHIAASGRIAVSGPTYRMEQGPDGRLYVTAGKVNFRMPPAQSPREKLELAEQLRRMALAPAKPSAKDRSVAAQAAQQISRARLELAAEQISEERDGEDYALPFEISRQPAIIGDYLNQKRASAAYQKQTEIRVIVGRWFEQTSGLPGNTIYSV